MEEPMFVAVNIETLFSSKNLYPKDDRNQRGYPGTITVFIYPFLNHIRQLRSVALEVS